MLQSIQSDEQNRAFILESDGVWNLFKEWVLNMYTEAEPFYYQTHVFLHFPNTTWESFTDLEDNSPLFGKMTAAEVNGACKTTRDEMDSSDKRDLYFLTIWQQAAENMEFWGYGGLNKNIMEFQEKAEMWAQVMTGTAKPRTFMDDDNEQYLMMIRKHAAFSLNFPVENEYPGFDAIPPGPVRIWKEKKKFLRKAKKFFMPYHPDKNVAAGEDTLTNNKEKWDAYQKMIALLDDKNALMAIFHLFICDDYVTAQWRSQMDMIDMEEKLEKETSAKEEHEARYQRAVEHNKDIQRQLMELEEKLDTIDTTNPTREQVLDLKAKLAKKETALAQMAEMAQNQEDLQQQLMDKDQALRELQQVTKDQESLQQELVGKEHALKELQQVANDQELLKNDLQIRDDELDKMQMELNDKETELSELGKQGEEKRVAFGEQITRLNQNYEISRSSALKNAGENRRLHTKLNTAVAELNHKKRKLDKSTEELGKEKKQRRVREHDNRRVMCEVYKHAANNTKVYKREQMMEGGPKFTAKKQRQLTIKKRYQKLYLINGTEYWRASKFINHMLKSNERSKTELRRRFGPGSSRPLLITRGKRKLIGVKYPADFIATSSDFYELAEYIENNYKTPACLSARSENSSLRRDLIDE
jgi:hypothetical protein